MIPGGPRLPVCVGRLAARRSLQITLKDSDYEICGADAAPFFDSAGALYNNIVGLESHMARRDAPSPRRLRCPAVMRAECDALAAARGCCRDALPNSGPRVFIESKIFAAAIAPVTRPLADSFLRRQRPFLSAASQRRRSLVASGRRGPRGFCGGMGCGSRAAARGHCAG